MALMSMTGFGRGESSSRGMKIEVEIGAVNRKQFDLRVALPRPIAALEPRVHELVHAKLSRGHVTCTARVVVSDNRRCESVSLDMSLARGYLRRLRGAAAELKLRDDLGLRDLLALPDVVRADPLCEDPETAWPVLRLAVQAALGDLLTMRRREGASLAKDLGRRFAQLRRRAVQIRRLAPRVCRRYREVLLKRIGDAGVPVQQDDPQWLREVAVFADRSDISEELIRLESHFSQADTLVESSKPVGRALDFLCQEMFREINTIGSKANDAAIAARVIEFKAILETVREQVQNIE